MLSDGQNFKVGRPDDFLDSGAGGPGGGVPVAHAHVLAGGPPGALHLDATAGAHFEPVGIDPFQVDYPGQLVPPSIDSPNFSLDYSQQVSLPTPCLPYSLHPKAGLSKH